MVENLVWAAGYNVVAVPLAAGALAWAGVTLSPAVGAVLMSLSTIVVAANAQLLRRVPLGRRGGAQSDHPTSGTPTAAGSGTGPGLPGALPVASGNR
jgi:Cu2+-exporting ATPase